MKYVFVTIAGVAVAASALAGTAAPRDVDSRRLRARVKSADRVVVQVPPYGRAAEILLDSSDPAVIKALQGALQVSAADSMCACLSSLDIRLYRAGKEVLWLGYLGERLHSSLWDGDAMLVDREKLLAWFDAQGIRGPREEARAEEERDRRAAASEKRWVEAMPPSLKPLWDEGRIVSAPWVGEQELGRWRAALEREIPDVRSRLAALLRWLGSGDGPWSGYPAYEAIAESLLLDFDVGDIVAVLQEGPDEQQLEGGARLLAGGDFAERWPRGLESVPASLKAMLLTHALKSADEDKRQRARAAFAP